MEQVGEGHAGAGAPRGQRAVHAQHAGGLGAACELFTFLLIE